MEGGVRLMAGNACLVERARGNAVPRRTRERARSSRSTLDYIGLSGV